MQTAGPYCQVSQAYSAPLSLRVQTMSAIIAVSSFVAAQLSARLLDFYPGSELLWYLNLGLFGFFRYARDPRSPLSILLDANVLLYTLCIGWIWLAYKTRHRLSIAIVTNFFFIVFLNVAYVAGFFSRPSAFLGEDYGCFLAVLLSSTFFASVLSHISYLRNRPLWRWLTRTCTGRTGLSCGFSRSASSAPEAEPSRGDGICAGADRVRGCDRDLLRHGRAPRATISGQ